MASKKFKTRDELNNKKKDTEEKENKKDRNLCEATARDFRKTFNGESLVQDPPEAGRDW